MNIWNRVKQHSNTISQVLCAAGGITLIGKTLSDSNWINITNNSDLILQAIPQCINQSIIFTSGFLVSKIISISDNGLQNIQTKKMKEKKLSSKNKSNLKPMKKYIIKATTINLTPEQDKLMNKLFDETHVVNIDAAYKCLKDAEWNFENGLKEYRLIMNNARRNVNTKEHAEEEIVLSTF